MKKKSKIIIGVVIGVVVFMVLFYFVIWPMVQPLLVQQSYCPKGYEAIRGELVWYCANEKEGKGCVITSDTEGKVDAQDCVDEWPLLKEHCQGQAKPIIYIYPKETTELTVKLGNPKNITTSYPKYIDGWNVIANPDGKLIDKDTNRQLYSLYWEGISAIEFSTEDGFVVKGEDTIKFLEEKLSILGLSETEAEEFIIYWLPLLEKNKYNYIRFASLEEINRNMPLELSKEPDSLIRVLMLYKKLDNPIEVKEQKLVTPERKGFVVVEWGGTNLDGMLR